MEPASWLLPRKLGRWRAQLLLRGFGGSGPDPSGFRWLSRIWDRFVQRNALWMRAGQRSGCPVNLCFPADRSGHLRQRAMPMRLVSTDRALACDHRCAGCMLGRHRPMSDRRRRGSSPIEVELTGQRPQVRSNSSSCWRRVWRPEPVRPDRVCSWSEGAQLPLAPPREGTGPDGVRASPLLPAEFRERAVAWTLMPN